MQKPHDSLSTRTLQTCAYFCIKLYVDPRFRCIRARAQRAQSTIPATLIGNWEIAGIRFRDVSQSVDITVIGHLKLPERKVTFVLVRRSAFGKMSDVMTPRVAV